MVLYRKYRPQTFAEIVGQEHVVQTLTNAIASGMISHAYLFGGPRGVGKTTVARIFAKALNCERRKEGEFEPCGQCPSCLEIMKGKSMDLIEIDAASHRGIDDIREIREGIKFVPTKSKNKIFIIDECHQLSKEASNAFLKTLEEPPPHVIFILATTEIHRMLPTIVSRCQRFDFRKLTVPEIVKRLKFIVQKEKAKVADSALELIALNARGSLRDAESLLDQAIIFSSNSHREVSATDIKKLLGLIDYEQVNRFTEILGQRKISEAIAFLNEIIERGFNLQEFVKSLINYLRRALIFKIIGDNNEKNSFNFIVEGFTSEEFQRFQKVVNFFSESELRRLLNLLLTAEARMKYSPFPQLPLELAIIEFFQNK